jgi:EmrB/QacA subfamily drug resistance transporter
VTTASPPAPGAALSHRQILTILSGLLLGMFLAALDQTVVATGIRTIADNLHGYSLQACATTAFLITSTITTPLYGKLSDQYGRKPFFMFAISIFIAGSALCGLSQSMYELAAFRAIQGLGAGGLFTLALAIIGDLVGPRERARYQGYFLAVFGTASVLGPVVGGFLAGQTSFLGITGWRWIFYINVPIGVGALVVLAATLPSRSARTTHAIDYAGAALLAVLLSALTLLTDLGGATYPWASPMILGLMATTIVALVLFLLVEQRAAEPMLPLRLFRDRSFAVASAVGFVVGFALFGSVVYLPLFLQIVKGASPTASGLQMLPMMGGMLVTSIVSGQLISKTGRYRIFPLVGTAVMSVGLFLLSRMSASTSIAAASGIMLTLGLGLGMVMQVLVIAVQNAVSYRDLGVATSGATLFRLIGGSLGTAVLGAVFAARLTRNLARALPDTGAGATITAHGMSAHTLAALPPELRDVYAHAFTRSLDTVFLVAMGVAIVGFALMWLMPEVPLRQTVAASAGRKGADAGGAFAQPEASDSASVFLRGLSMLASRDVQRQFIERVVARAGVSLSAGAAWLLVRVEQDPGLDPVALGAKHRVPAERMRAAETELRQRELIDGTRALTTAGRDVLERLVRARRAKLSELLAEWPAGQREEAIAAFQGLAREVVPDVGSRVSRVSRGQSR